MRTPEPARCRYRIFHPQYKPGTPEALVSQGAPSSTSPSEGFIEARGGHYLQDVNADGLADLVISVRLAGGRVTHDAGGNPLALAQGLEKHVAIVFINTGDPATGGWIRDDTLATGLPPFDEVMFESAWATESQSVDRDSYDYQGYTHGIACLEQGLHGYYWYDGTSGRGESGTWYSNRPDLEQDVCFNTYSLEPRFADFNGDGYVDVMVLERQHPDLLWVGYRDNPFGGPSTNFAQSRVWIQRPGENPRWQRAAGLDLPLVDVGFPYYGGEGTGYWPGPRLLAHSWLQHFALAGYGKGLQVDDCPHYFSYVWCGPLARHTDNGVRIVDLNRDGLADVVWSLSGGPGFDYYPVLSRGVLLNTGRGWCGSSTGYSVPYCAEAAGYLLPRPIAVLHLIRNMAWGQPADLNGDALVDFFSGALWDMAAWIQSPATAPGQTVWLEDNRFSWARNNAYPTPEHYAYADFNGDGIVDSLGDESSGPCCTSGQPARLALSRSRHPDLLKRVVNGMGGAIQISYESAPRQRFLIADDREARASAHAGSLDEEPTTRDVVLWTPTAVVSQVEVSGPNLAGTPVTTYRYAHPRFCYETRSYLGFRLVERTRPDSSVVSQYFYQRHGRAGRLSELTVKNGAGSTLFEYVEDWARDGDPDLPQVIPGTIADVRNARLRSTRSAYRYGAAEGSAVARAFGYDDVYGFNFVDQVGEIRPTGTVTTQRAPEGKDLGRWIVGLVDWQKTTTSAGAARLSESWFDYALGRVTQRQDLDQLRDGSDPAASRTITSTFAYDGFGNLAQRTDMPGTSDVRTTEFCYDGDQKEWCDSFGQSSHSVVVGVRQFFWSQETNQYVPMVQTFEPDPMSGVRVGYASTFTD